jgi:hypothetical protein
MIALIKLLVAHFIGDFLLQPKSWVIDKEIKKAASSKLYIHVIMHGILVLLLLWNLYYWLLALAIMVTHGILDTIKIYLQNETNRTRWFLIDQGLHVGSIFLFWFVFFHPEIDITTWLENSTIWLYALALLFITIVSGIVIRELMSGWTKVLQIGDEESLTNAGKYIGMLERVFVFTFVVAGNWEGIGFLLAAKSVFRFGDLKESKDRKLTEYILIGTLLSFGIAMATGMLVVQCLEN